MKAGNSFMALALLVMVLAGCHPSGKTNPADTFSKANAAYKKGDFKGAIKLYQEITVSGFASEALYYNLGNAFMKDGQLGRAITSYERAARLYPRDSDLKANIAFARGMVDPPEPQGAKEGIFVHLKEITLNEIVMILVVAGLGISAFFLAGLFLNWRFRKTAFLMVLLSVVFVFHIFALLAKIEDQRDRAVVLSAVDARYEPEEAATTHFIAGEGWKVRVLKESSGWIKVQRADGLEGWVPEEKIERI
jgi:tetratricopeptide (TPR) repeat protein